MRFVKHTVTAVTYLAAVAVTALALATWFTPAESAQPYGGCKEALAYPHTAGARDCRALGWTVNANVVVSPRSVLVATRWEPCRRKDSHGCYWDARGEGRSFYVNRQGEYHYVKTVR